MKVLDLFEAKRVDTDKGYYTPGYDEKTKLVKGTVDDWMARLGATKADIADAMQQAKELPSYQAISEYEITTAGERKNGTFSFQKPGAGKETDDKYKVNATGLIRSSSRGTVFSDDHRATRMTSPKPRLVAGNVVKSLVKIYDGAFKELAKKMDQRKAVVLGKKLALTEPRDRLALVQKEYTAATKRKVTESADDAVEKVFARLDMTHPTERDKKSMAADILDKTEEGWTIAEIVSHMRNMEEVNPDVDEDTALARMKRIRDAVMVRLKSEK